MQASLYTGVMIVLEGWPIRAMVLIFGSLLPVIASITYGIAIFEGRAKPERMTRLLLTVITAVSVTSLWAGGDTSGVWLALVAFIQSVGILGLSIKRGVGGHSQLDILCLVLCFMGVLLWLTLGRPWIGVWVSILTDCIAVVPALHKTIRLPHTEPALFYGLDVIAGLLIMSVGPFTLQAIAFPLYIATINLIFVVAIMWPRKVSDRRLTLSE